MLHYRHLDWCILCLKIKQIPYHLTLHTKNLGHNFGFRSGGDRTRWVSEGPPSEFLWAHKANFLHFYTIYYDPFVVTFIEKIIYVSKHFTMNVDATMIMDNPELIVNNEVTKNLMVTLTEL